MTIDYSKSFRKQYAKLPPRIQEKADERILLWQRDPRHPVLRDHALEGKYKMYRSIDITGDFRALYVRYNDSAVFDFIGTHSQLYG